MNPRRWLQDHSLKLLAIRDTPAAIAGGVAIGIFVGFTPLFGFKTLLAILFAWLTRSNLIAAILATTLHDLLFPVLPVIYLWEYKIGFLLLNSRWPEGLSRVHLHWSEWRNWRLFVKVIVPTLIGSVICGLPLAGVSFFVMRGIMIRHQHKKHPPGPPGESPVAKD